MEDYSARLDRILNEPDPEPTYRHFRWRNELITVRVTGSRTVRRRNGDEAYRLKLKLISGKLDFGIVFPIIIPPGSSFWMASPNFIEDLPEDPHLENFALPI